MMRDYYVTQRLLRIEQAERELARTHAELDYVGEQLALAKAGKPYLRIGRIDTLDAGPIFMAFGAIEHLALYDKHQEGYERHRP